MRFGGFAALTTVLVLVAGLFASDPPKPAAKPSAPAGTQQDLIFFTADGPVRVRVSVTIAGRPAEELWQNALDALFAYCDRNGDGSLNERERQPFQNGRRGYSQFIIVDGAGYVINQPRAVSFTNKDGKVDRTAFQDGFRDSGLGAVSANGVAPRGDSGQLTDALFKHLDTDKDGNLSVAELKAARERLTPLDVDEDEMITSNELVVRVQNQYFEAVQLLDAYGDGGRQQVQIADVLMPASGRLVAVKDVLAARDTDKDGALTATELGCNAKVFKALDADGDGRLDTDELTAWLRSPPDLDLAVRLNSTQQMGMLLPERPSVPLKVVGLGRIADRVKTEWDGSIRLTLPDARFRFAADTVSGSLARSQYDAGVQNIRSVFKMTAGDAGALDREKITQSPELVSFLPMFDFADRDGNRKVTIAELDRVTEALRVAVSCRAAVSVSDQGRGLFELLDRDGDSRLSPRELAAAPELVAALDQNGDGKLSRTELPRGLAVNIQAESVDVFPMASGLAFPVTIYSGGSAGPAVSPAANVPEWFRNADRNADGDVSAREFAGPPALFRKIDTDGDGLISPEEARAFEKSLSKPARP